MLVNKKKASLTLTIEDGNLKVEAGWTNEMELNSFAQSLVLFQECKLLGTVIRAIEQAGIKNGEVQRAQAVIRILLDELRNEGEADVIDPEQTVALLLRANG